MCSRADRTGSASVDITRIPHRDVGLFSSVFLYGIIEHVDIMKI